MKSIHVISLGTCAVLAQTVFVREMLALFTGTELVVGALLAGWLFWVGVGGIVGGRLIGAPERFSYVTFEQLAIAIALLYPATTIAIRLGRGYLVQPPGSVPSFLPALAFSLIAMAPYGFFYGTAYNVASALAARKRGGLTGGITRAYVWEAVGAVIGAFIFSLLLAAKFSQLETTFIISFSLIAIAILVRRGNVSYRRRLPLVLGIGLIFLVLAPVLDRASIEAVFPGHRVERFLSSRYGELVAASREEVISFFSGGSRLFSVPEPERAEESVHIPLLAHPAPRRVLLIGGSLGGGWEEALRHATVESIDCIEMDGALLGLYRDIDSSRASSGESRSGRTGVSAHTPSSVRFVREDGRFFLTEHGGEYDVIIVNAPPPLNLRLNRYYTVEFFSLVKRSLAPGGIFACSHPSAENFLSHDQAMALRALRSTMEFVFGRISVLPGSTAHFVTGAVDAERLLARLAERDIETLYISKDYLPFRFSKERIEMIEERLDDVGTVSRNTDLRPVMPIYEILLEGRRVGISGVGFLENLLAVPFFAVPLVCAAAFVFLFARAKGQRAARMSVMAVGFGSLLFQVMVLCALQSFSGHLYHAIVLLTALFMGGAAAGAVAARRRTAVRRIDFRLVHFGFVALVLSFAALLSVGHRAAISAATGEAVFYIYATAGGFLTGFFYALVIRTAIPGEKRVIPAIFYSWDLFGACMGGIIGGAVLVPGSGLIATAVLIAVIHLLAMGILVGRW